MVILMSGFVNDDSVVDALDLSLVVSTYGSSTVDRTDGSGSGTNYVDLNADGSVSGLDISPVISNISLAGIGTW